MTYCMAKRNSGLERKTGYIKAFFSPTALYDAGRLLHTVARLLYDEDMLDNRSGDAGQSLHILLSIRSAEFEFASRFIPTDIDIGHQV